MDSKIIPREEAAEHLRVPTRLLLRYEMHGLIRTVHRGDAEGYEPRELRRVWSVVSLHRDAGINLAGVEAILRLKDRIEALHERVSRLAETLEGLMEPDISGEDQSDE